MLNDQPLINHPLLETSSFPVGHVPDALNNALFAFQILTTILIILISLPQLIKLLKEKRTGQVSYTSFWLYHYGILFWVFFAAFAPGQMQYPDGQMHSPYISTLIGETIAVFINGAMLFLLYYFKQGMAKKNIIIAAVIISINLLAAVAFLVVHFTTPQQDLIDINGEVIQKAPRLNAIAATVLSLIGPMGVVLPFTPQLIKSFKTKQWQGVSYWMYIMFTINNICFLVFWILGIKQQLMLYPIGNPEHNNYLNWVGNLIWECIAFFLFGIQLFFTIDDRIKRRKGLRTDVLEQPQTIKNQPKQSSELVLER